MEKEIIKRKNLRIPEYDYSEEGYYYITICTKDRKQILSKIINIENKYVGANDPVRPKGNYNSKIVLTSIGKIVSTFDFVNNL